jgi:hypothetical protein
MNPFYFYKTVIFDLFSKNSVANPDPHHFGMSDPASEWKVGSGSTPKSKYMSCGGSKWSRGGSEDGTGSIKVKSRKRVRIRINRKSRVRIRIRITEKGRIRVRIKGWRSVHGYLTTAFEDLLCNYLLPMQEHPAPNLGYQVINVVFLLILDKTTGTGTCTWVVWI